MKVNNRHTESEVRLVYNKMIDVFFFFKPITDLKEIVHQDFMGYGTAAHEFFRNGVDVTEMAELQSEQLRSQNVEIHRKPILERVFAEGTSCLIMEEFDMYFKDTNHHLVARLSTILERIDGKWLVTHFHGSTPDSNIAEDEAFPMEGLRKKNEELEIKIKERTRVLEIETALERVRAVAMAMRESEDLATIGEHIFTELKNLGFNDLRNTEVIINHDSKSLITSYYYSDYGVTGTLDMDYRSNPIVKEWANALKKADDAFAKVVIPEKELEEWIKYRLSLGYLPDPKLKKANTVYHYSYSIGLGALSISSFQPVTTEQSKILERFRNLFNLSYQRYIDISQAEAQAREAEIELALERVRAKTMSIQDQDGLLDVITLLADQLVQLGIELDSANFSNGLSQKKGWDIWIYNKHFQPDMRTSRVFYPWFDHPMFHEVKALIEDYKKGIDLNVAVFDKEQLKSFVDYVFTDTVYKDAEDKDSIKEAFYNVPGYTWTVICLKDTWVSMNRFNTTPFTDEENAIFRRFANAFGQAYTRFLDLQKAAVQARETQIELGLERVRARAMAMQKSNELSELVDTVFKELTKLDLALSWCIINIIDEPSMSNMVWGANPQIGKEPESYHMLFEDYRFHHEMFKAWKEKQDKWVFTLKGAEKEVYDEYLFSQTEFRRVPETVQEEMRATKQYVASFTFSNFGGLQTIGEEPLSDESLDILGRFGKVFDLTYTRFNDLQKAEAQTRESRINLGVERVRAMALGMHRSEDIMRVVAKLKDEVLNLDIMDIVAATIFLNEGDEKIRMWDLTSIEKIDDGYQVPLDITFKLKKTDPHLYVKRVWENPDNYFIETQDEKGFKRLLELFREHGKTDGAEEIEEYIKSSQLKLLYHATKKLNNGKLCIDVSSPPTDEMETILTKMGGAFDLAYKRFLDLQNAEIQTREAQVELSLERIRAQVTAMKESSDLLDIVVTMHSEFTSLDHEAQYFWHMRWLPDTYQKALTSVDGSRIGMVMELPRGFHENAAMTAWENNKEPVAVFPYDAEDAIDYVDKMIRTGRFDEIDHNAPGPEDIRAIGGITFVMARTTHGEIGYSLPGVVPNPPAEDLETLIRFAGVFDLAYKRFEDLKQAEQQNREAQIELALERVRSRTMGMQKSEELGDVATVLFKELNQLVDNLWTCGFVLCEKDRDEDEWWLSDQNGFIPAFYLSNVGDEAHANIYNAWKSGVDYHTEQLEGDALQKHYKWLMNIPAAKKIFDEMMASGFELPTWQKLHCAYFKTGYLVIITQVPCPEEEIFKRFAQVFDLTYTRFLDLQLKETQARKLAEDKLQLEKTLSDLQATQSQLIQSEKMASLGELTAGIAHEIQNPLNFVNNFSDVSKELLEEMMEEMQKGDVEEVKALAEDIIQNLEKINHHGKRADGIVKGMLQHSRSSNGVKEPTDINALADEYLRLAYHGLRAKDKSFNAKFETTFEEGIGKVNVIPQDIGRVVLNLITNAFYAVNERKKLDQKGYEPTVMVTTKKEGDTIFVSVKDNGNGIPDSVKEKIFQPFFTTKPTGQGTGLGLSMSYDIITKGHGGKLDVESEAGKGTTFTISLPK